MSRARTALAEPLALARTLGERALWLVLLAALLLWVLAYQIPYQHTILFGGDAEQLRRRDDEPFLRGWNDAPEPVDAVWLSDAWRASGQQGYRWAMDEADLVLPGLGGGRWLVAISVAGQPKDTPTPSVWSDGTTTSTLQLSRAPQRYAQLFATDAWGDLALHFSTPRLDSPGDPRPLGFAGYRASVRSVGWQLPPAAVLGWLALAVGAAYALARRLGAAQRWAALGGLLAALLLAVALALWRLAITGWAAPLGLVALGCYPLALLALRVPPLLAVPCAPWQRQAMAGLVALAFAIRLGGMLHPQILFSDVEMNANKLRAFAEGAVYQSAALPSETGGGLAPYPVGQYIVAAPAQVLFAPPQGAESVKQAYKLVLMVSDALLDSAVVAMIWYVLAMGGYGQAAALLGAALYLAPSATLRSFNVGELANVAGQAMAVPLLALLAAHGGRLRQPRVAALALALMLMAMLGHSGVTISMGLTLACLAGLWLLAARSLRAVLPLLAVGAAAAALLGLLYYSAQLHLLLTVGGSAPMSTRSVPTRLLDELRRVFAGTDTTITPPLMLLAAAGAAWLLWARRGLLTTRLVLAAWWASALLSLAALAARDQTLRWDLFLYPALCLSAGPALAWLYGRGRWGRAAALGLAALLVGLGLAGWGLGIANRYHVI